MRSRPDLNPQQQAVVDAGGGPILVLAGAGTGKTRTLTRRIERLLSMGVPTRAICLLTFTNRAAEEMVTRLSGYGLDGLDDMWSGTFHSLAARALRLDGHALGWPETFSILDAEDSRQLMTRALQATAHPALIKLGAKKAHNLYSLCVQRLEPLENVLRSHGEDLLALGGHLGAAFQGYMRLKQSCDALDFEDLLVGWRQLLQSRLDSGRPGRFEHVCVDEYQDTNPLQAQIVDLLASTCGNLTVVGDDAQSIYGFRGADHRGMQSFEARHPRTKVHKLEINYRSSPEIIALANASIAHNVDQLPKTLKASQPSGPRPSVVPCRDAVQQARFVVHHIEAMASAGRSLSEVAVLYRSHRMARELQNALAERGVPFSLGSGLPFYERAHIKDVLALLKLAQNKRDEAAMARVATWLPGVGPKALERARPQIARGRTLEEGLALAARGASGRARSSFEGLALLLDGLDPTCSPGPWLEELCESPWVKGMLERRDKPRQRLEELRSMARHAARCDDLEAFLTETALMASERGRVGVLGEREDARLTLSTIHKSKGLEWPVVIVIGVAEGRFPRGFGITDPKELEEERRLLYVAMTRAQEQLVITWPRSGIGAKGRYSSLGPSVFMREIDAPSGAGGLVEVWRLEEALDDQV